MPRQRHRVGRIIRVGTVVIIRSLRMRNYQKCGSLKENNLVGIAETAEVDQLGLEQANVGDQTRHDVAPGLVERFVPDTGTVALEVLDTARDTTLGNQALALFQDKFAVLICDEIHLVDQNKDSRIGTVLLNRF